MYSYNGTKKPKEINARGNQTTHRQYEPRNADGLNSNIRVLNSAPFELIHSTYSRM